jgi:tetratricopeptide (TPR) repeat protein
MTPSGSTCPGCGAASAADASFCARCGSRLIDAAPLGSAAFTGETRLPETGRQVTPPFVASARLEPGTTFGPRYRILNRLGEGGMGIVYQAWDDELGIPVALKVIRPEVLASGDAADQIERRFKRELVLARQVTHKHVVRIHDIGEFGGVRYLTMPFIEGRDLASLLAREGALPVSRALHIGRQVAEGLAAAHEVGVVHRDLKPENVMVDADDTAIIMDFGLARSAAGTTLTKAGALLGTLAYMAPEQARGEAVDERADIYAWGLMMYDMLAGRRRLGQFGDAMSELLARIQKSPPPIRTLEPRVPEALERVLSRCIESDRDERYATSRELVAVLATLDHEGHAKSPSLVAHEQADTRTSRGRKLQYAIAAAVLALAVAIGAWLVTGRAPEAPPAAREPLSVLIADFQNNTGDPVFSGAVEDALALGIEGASFITAFSRRDAERVARQIRPDARLDEETARLVSRREGIRTVLAGAITPEGPGFRVTVRAVDPVPGTVLAEASEVASGKADVLNAVGQLSARIRRALGDATPESTMAAERETFTASSIESAADYAEAQRLASNDRDDEAIALYERAIAADPQLGRAYAGLAQSAYKLGRIAEAEQYYKKAFSLVDRMTEREKFRTLGTYYLNIAGNYELAIENFEALLAKYPADGAGHNNLALAYFHTLQFEKARAEGEELLNIYPANALYRYNQALYAMYAGDFERADERGRAALEINPLLPKAHLAIAMSALAGGRIDDARAGYERAREAGPRGASLAAIGLADLAMHQGRFDEAVPLLTTGIERDLESKNTAGAAAKAIALAEAQYALGNQTAAGAAIERARQIVDTPSVLVPAAQLLLDMGRDAEVARIADRLEQSIATRPRAYARLVRAMMLVRSGNVPAALEMLQEAQKLADLWLVRYHKGVAYVAAGAYPEALRELDACTARRGEATAVFLDDVPTYRYTVPLSYWLGRTHDALGSRERARQYFAEYLAVRSPGTDSLARDAAARMR